MSDFNGVPAEDDVPVVETSGDAWNDAMVEDESPIAAPESLSGAQTISTPLPPPPPMPANVKSGRKLRALVLALAVVAVGFGGGRIDPVLGARRREPRADGLQHATPRRPAVGDRGPVGGHGSREPSGSRFPRGHYRRGGRQGGQCHRLPDYRHQGWQDP